jgi:hypothetical protein
MMKKYKRQNIGFADGYYDFGASGHVDNNESTKTSKCREAKEELYIDINHDDLYIYFIKI